MASYGRIQDELHSAMGYYLFVGIEIGIDQKLETNF